MFSKLGFKLALVSTIAIFAVAVGAIFLGAGTPMGNPLFVTDTKITSANPFDRGCVMTLKDRSGQVQTFKAFTADCFEYVPGSSVYISGDRVYEY